MASDPAAIMGSTACCRNPSQFSWFLLFEMWLSLTLNSATEWPRGVGGDPRGAHGGLTRFGCVPPASRGQLEATCQLPFSITSCLSAWVTFSSISREFVQAAYRATANARAVIHPGVTLKPWGTDTAGQIPQLPCL